MIISIFIWLVLFCTGSKWICSRCQNDIGQHAALCPACGTRLFS